MNPQLSSLSQASALVIYVLSFSQETHTADYSLPLCSTLPCLWAILCLFPQYFSRWSNQVLFLFPWKPRKHCLKNQTNHLLGHHYLPHIHMWASDPRDPRKKGASDKNRNLPLLPPPCHMGRKPHGHIYSSSAKKPKVLWIQCCWRQLNSTVVTNKGKMIQIL